MSWARIHPRLLLCDRRSICYRVHPIAMASTALRDAGWTGAFKRTKEVTASETIARFGPWTIFATRRNVLSCGTSNGAGSCESNHSVWPRRVAILVTMINKSMQADCCPRRLLLELVSCMCRPQLGESSCDLEEKKKKRKTASRDDERTAVHVSNLQRTSQPTILLERYP